MLVFYILLGLCVKIGYHMVQVSRCAVNDEYCGFYDTPKDIRKWLFIEIIAVFAMVFVSFFIIVGFLWMKKDQKIPKNMFVRILGIFVCLGLMIQLVRNMEDVQYPSFYFFFCYHSIAMTTAYITASQFKRMILIEYGDEQKEEDKTKMKYGTVVIATAGILFMLDVFCVTDYFSSPVLDIISMIIPVMYVLFMAREVYVLVRFMVYMKTLPRYQSFFGVWNFIIGFIFYNSLLQMYYVWYDDNSLMNPTCDAIATPLKFLISAIWLTSLGFHLTESPKPPKAFTFLDVTMILISFSVWAFYDTAYESQCLFSASIFCLTTSVALQFIMDLNQEKRYEKNNVIKNDEIKTPLL